MYFILYICIMALKAKQFYTVSCPQKGVVLWDTTLKPLCKQLKEFDNEALGFDSITRNKELKEDGVFTFTTKSGVNYIVQHLTRT